MDLKTKRMKKNKKRKKTPRYVQEQYWSTTMMVDDELVDRRNVWEFYYFAAATVVPLLEDFLDVAEFKAEKGCPRFFRELPENAIESEDFENIRGNYTNKEGKSPIIIRITINGEYERINSTLSIEPELWDAKAGRAIDRTAKVLELNKRLEYMRVVLKEH